MDAILDTLRQFDALRDEDNFQTEITDRIKPEYAPSSVFDHLDPQLRDRLDGLGIKRLYDHQGQAISAALKGQNVVLEAPTASGKTLAFAIPVLQSLMQGRDAHALFIYPMKAVAMDQRTQLLSLHKGLSDSGHIPIESWTYDGDVTPEQRKWLRESPPSMLMTNIEFINYSFLAFSDVWEQFLENLKWVVIDEIHEYRGYFGTNAAMVLRRLVHHLSSKGRTPNFFMATATCANPLEHAQNLTGIDFELVSARESLQPRSEYLFVDPDIPHHQYWPILQLRAAKAALALCQLGKSAIIFCPTRQFAEQSYRLAVSEWNKLHHDTVASDSIQIYKGGMNAEDRHEILDGLKGGEVKIVFSTNALELGIDVPGLDAVVMVGFPDNVMSARQQLGRAGRSYRSDGLVIYYARNNPLDSFYARNLQTFLNKPLDEVVVDTANEEIADAHATCVLYESDVDAFNGNEGILGEGVSKIVKKMISEGQTPVRSGKYRPHRNVAIRGATRDPVWELEVDSKPLGNISSYQKFKEAYDRAILLQGGVKYRVSGFRSDSSKSIVELAREETNHRTDAYPLKNININDFFAGAKWGDDLEAMLCHIAVYEYIAQVTERVEGSDETIDRWNPKDSAFRSHGHSFRLKFMGFDPEVAAMAALEQILRVGVRFNIPADEHDTYTFCDTKECEIYIVESYPGGIGIVKKAYEKWQDVLREGMQVAKSCRCVSGCPYCIVPPRRTEEIDKRSGLRLADQLLDASRGDETHELIAGTWKPRTVTA